MPGSKLRNPQELSLVDAEALDKLQQDIVSHIDVRFQKLQAELLGAISAAMVDKQSPQPKQHDTPYAMSSPILCPITCTSHQQSSAGTGAEIIVSSKHDPKIGMQADLNDQPVLASSTSKLAKEKAQPGQPRGAFTGRANLFALLQVKNWDSDAAQEPEVEIAIEVEDASSPESPLRKKFKAFINSTTFDLIVGFLILLNSVIMGIQLEYAGIQSANMIGLESDEGQWPNAEDAFNALEHIFAICFLVELILRLTVMGCTYFHDILNWMDFGVVVVALVELYVFPFIDTELDMSIVRLLRVFRILRLLRMVRVLKLMPKLRVLVVAIAHSVWSLIWSLLLLGLVQLIASIFMTKSLQQYLQDEAEDPVQRAQVYTFFGSFSRSLITLWEITLASGTWGRCGRVVIFSVSRWYAVFFLGYMGLVSFAMIRVISAIFLKDTLSSAAKDSEEAMADQNKDPEYIQQAWAVFQKLDENSNGVISVFELSTMLRDETTQWHLTKLGVKPHEVPGLFMLMDDGDDEINFGEFLAGIMRLKNASKGVDLATLLYENKKLLKRVLSIKSDVGELRKDLGHSMHRSWPLS